MSNSLEFFSRMQELLVNQTFDEKLATYKMQKYPLDRISNHRAFGSHFYYILDYETLKHPYISDGWKNILDYPDSFWERGVYAIFEIIHPDDTIAMNKIHTKICEFVLSQPSEKALNQYLMSFDFRAIKNNGAMINVLQQPLYISLDKKGNILYEAGVVYDISHFKNNGDLCLQITGLNGEKVLEYYPNQDPYLNNRQIEETLSKLGQLSLNNTFFRKMRKIIRNNMYKDNLSLNTLSTKMDISPAQLNRKVKSALHIPPSKLIHLTRLKEATRLLTQEHYTIAEIAYKCGFSSPAYFTRRFRQMYNCTPSTYKKMLRKRKKTPENHA